MSAISRWFIDNPIAAKIIMLMILIGGISTYFTITKTFFPIFESDIIRVTAIYPGAGPEEVEKQVTQRIEEAVDQLGGIEEIRSTSTEGFADVKIEASPEMDVQSLLNDVRANVDSISTFPASLERLQIVEQRSNTEVMKLLLTGGTNEQELKEKAEEIREELAAYSEVDIVSLTATRKYEVSIEIREQRLREFGLTFADVANAIRGYSFDQSVGKIKDSRGDVQLQIRLQAENAVDFSQIPIVRQSNGSIIYVSDIAYVIDGFEDVDKMSQFNGRDTVVLDVITQSSPDILRTTDRVKSYLDEKGETLGADYQLSIISDLSISYRGRLDTLFKNGAGGLGLVFIMLVFFLKPVLALWVCAGIAVAFFGSLWMLGFTYVTFNVLSMFAFIMILGIVVDDAIIIGESVHTQQQLCGDKRLGAIRGVTSMVMPVTFAVVSTIIFFLPFFDLSEAPDSGSLATPVILALIFSLIESLFLLPSHLAATDSKSGKNVKAEDLNSAEDEKKSVVSRSLSFIGSQANAIVKPFNALQEKTSAFFPAFANSHYRRWIALSIARKRFTLVIFGFVFLSAIAALRGGWLGFYFFPEIESDFVITTAKLPESSSFSQSLELLENISQSAERLKEETNRAYQQDFITNVYSSAQGNTVIVLLAMDDTQDRPISARELATAWRRDVGKVYGVTELNVSYSFAPIPKPIAFEVKGHSLDEMRAFSAELITYIESLNGPYAAQSTLESPSSEINLSLSPSAESLNINMREVSDQVNAAFYGQEVQRIPRGREDVKVFLRYPREDRSYEEVLTQMDLRMSTGEYVPLASLVEFAYRDTYKKIERMDGMRIARVVADVHRGFPSGELSAQVEQHMKDELLPRYPGIRVSVAGEQEERREFFQKFVTYFGLSLIAIYGLMAVIFRSYWQPFLVISAIPFGFAGGIFGHMIVGTSLSMMSILGMLACAGVVVNDNVVLIDRINQLRALGYSARRAVVEAGIQRFRPIVLTSLTTFLGLTPILLETSIQAQFLIPMVTSLAFGVLFATVITLIFVPSLYLAGHRIIGKLGLDTTVSQSFADRARLAD